MNTYIPTFHFRPQSEKLTKKWAAEAINYYYRSGGAVSLLSGKKVTDIERFASGDQDMAPFKKMYKSLKRAEERNVTSPNNLQSDIIVNNTLDALDWDPLGLLPTPLNSALSNVTKLPIEITATAVDGLAMTKKERDRELLRNKRLYEKDTADIAAKLGIEKIDIGGLQNDSSGYDELPLGLDPESQDDQDLFMNLFYKLKPESAFETVLTANALIKKVDMVRKLESMDTLKYGVQCHRSFINDSTGLPDVEYEFPGDIYTPDSALHDYSDIDFWYKVKGVTLSQLYSMFGSEIEDEKALDAIMAQYCKANGYSVPHKLNRSDFIVTLVYIEWRSIDYENISFVKDRKGKVRYDFADERAVPFNDGKKGVRRRYAQNTYCAYWLLNTDQVFDNKVLPMARREKGQEAYSFFSLDVYRSTRKSIVELAIPEVKSAQRSYIKLQHCIIKSLPPGKMIDLRFIRGAVEALSEEDARVSVEDLLSMVFEQNHVLTDTEDFNGKTDGNFKAFDTISGGLGKEVEGYILAIREAIQNIARLTGINDQLQGTAPNPEGLVGMQKLLIQQSINAIYYMVEATKAQYGNLFTHWASMVQQIFREGGPAKEALITMIGDRKADVLEWVKDIPLHMFGIQIEVTQREVERQYVEEQLAIGMKAGTLTPADAALIRRIKNPKDAMALLVVRERKARKEREEAARMAAQVPLQVEQQRQQGEMQKQQLVNQGGIQKEQAKGETQVAVQQALMQLNMNMEAFKNQLKSNLQNERAETQKEKALLSQAQKAMLERQEA